MNIKKCLQSMAAICVLGLTGTANAAIIEDLYGDKDGFGSGITDGSLFHYSLVTTEADDEGITDRGLYGDDGWTHSFDISGLGAITNASLELFVGGLGAYGGSASLYIDSVFVGFLTDGDSCGTGVCGNTAHKDIFNLNPYLDLLDGAASVAVKATYSGDFWALDYSLLTIETGTSKVPEPSAILLLSVGLLGLFGVRKKASAKA